MVIRIFAGAIAIAALVSACGGAPEGDPAPSPPASTAGKVGAPAGGEHTLDIPGPGNGKIFCPKCPIQCPPGDPCSVE
jgi:hypothetical protein